jgi:hypothetical protein
MATAVDLPQAAGQSFENLFTLWTGGGNSLRNALAAFTSSLLPLFPDQDTIGRPIADWLTLIGAAAQLMPGVAPLVTIPFEQLVTAADYVYRICWLGAGVTATLGVPPPQITTAQRTALLAAYNLNF